MSIPLPRLSQLSARVENIKKREFGSGFVYVPPSHVPYVYILTAKHCIYGKTFKYKTRPEQLRVYFSDGEEPAMFTPYNLSADDKIIADDSNVPDLALLQIERSSLPERIVLAESHPADFDPAELSALFKGYPYFTGNGDARTVELTIVKNDSTRLLVRGETRTAFRDDAAPDDNVEGFSGSGLCIELAGRFYLIGIVYEYEAASNRFHSCGVKDWLAAKVPASQWYDIPSERLLPFEKFKANVAESVRLLGPRYSEDFTFEVPLQEIAPFLAADESSRKHLILSFRKAADSYEQFLRAHRDLPRALRSALNGKILEPDIFRYVPSIISFSDWLEKHRLLLRKLAALIEHQPFPEADFEQMPQVARALYESAYTVLSAIHNHEEYHPQDQRVYKPYRENVASFSNETETFLGYFSGNTFQTLAKPHIRLGGEAGSGKSHLLADIAMQRMGRQLPTFLLLGQNFLKDEDPWLSVLNMLGLPEDQTDILEILSEKARRLGQRILIFIDAINEGLGLSLWPRYLSAFLDRFKAYPYIGLVLSYRSSYEEVIFGAPVVARLVSLQHYGFAGYEVEAFNAFALQYKIRRTSVPVLSWEFSNPLFLKLFCIGLQQDPDYDPSGKVSIDRIFRYYVTYVNQRLSVGFDYDHVRLNLVRKVLDAFTEVVVGQQLKPMPYDEATVLTERTVGDYTARRRFLDGLLRENIFIDQVRYDKDQELVFFIQYAYQRFGDLAVARRLINLALADHRAALREKGLIMQFFGGVGKQRHQQGLLEALAILWPAFFGEELHESVTDEYRYSQPFVSAFLDSLAWRSIQPSTQAINDIFQLLISSAEMRKLLPYFWDTMLELALDTGNRFNANFLHALLKDMTLADRDAYWTTFLQLKYPVDEQSPNQVSRLLRWAWKAGAQLVYEDEVVLLGATALGWFLSSTNRGLRDEATKALVFLFGNYPAALPNWISRFMEVNDPYVVQRVYAVAYGAAVRWSDGRYLNSLAEQVYFNFFDHINQYPDILTRDYARGIVEFALLRNPRLNFDMDRIKPPYIEELSVILSEVTDVAKYRQGFEPSQEARHLRGVDKILDSMVVDRGSFSRYGDFGRYVFQSALRYWPAANAALLSNLAVQLIMERYGYDPEKHGAFDTVSLGSSERIKRVHMERIGKKYQWIAFFEILALVADGLPFHPDDRRAKFKPKRFNGPWEPFVRDIDPTFVANPLVRKQPHWFGLPAYEGLLLPNEQWVKQIEDLPRAIDFASVSDDYHRRWLVLELHTEYSEPIDDEEIFKQSRKRLWVQLRSYVTRAADYTNIITGLEGANFMNRWMPEYHSDYTVFNREYYWSPAYDDLYRQRETWHEVEYRNAVLGHVSPTAWEYHWEAEFDNSKEDGQVHILKPAQLIYDILGLRDGRRDGEFVDDSGEVVCFDPSVNYAAPSCLLVDEAKLYQALNKKRLKIFWTILGEKQVTNSDLPLVSFSALISRTQGKLTGDYHLFQETEEF